MASLTLEEIYDAFKETKMPEDVHKTSLEFAFLMAGMTGMGGFSPETTTFDEQMEQWKGMMPRHQREFFLNLLTN